MKSLYARYGIPDEIVPDNMPFASKAFRNFASEWGFEVSTSSPRNPQSNGMSERALQTIKNLLRKAFEDGNDPYQKLRQRSDKQKVYYDQNAKPLPIIKEGETARKRKGKTWEPAIVTPQHTTPSSFMVTTPDGTAYRRNRCHLLPTDESPLMIAGPPTDLQATPLAEADPLVGVAPPDDAIPSLDPSN
ncbi:HERV-K-8p23.1 provirus ancestral Pol protein [Stylophora pistillata]|uniref:HERV-K-8p23.1 provirus ancestral Pol protein n=1 Tax=Stylophora pistillata TaxID=50429 RepID=A0A2B4R8H5_STYPI|nr:HERV-K-8p23.1 provirus ancestral Pol protein [Stylophora pistillata]